MTFSTTRVGEVLAGSDVARVRQESVTAPWSGTARLLWRGVLGAAVSLALNSTAMAAVLASWDVHGLAGGANSFGTSPLAPGVTDPGVTVVGLTRGSGVSTTGTAAARAWGGVDWQNSSAATAVSGNDVVTFSVTPAAGSQV